MSASAPYSSDPRLTEAVPSEAAVGDPDAGLPPSAARAAWWLTLTAAVFGVVMGIVMVAWPEATLKVVAVLFGFWLIVHGVVRIVQAITGNAAGGAERAMMGLIGLFFVVAGVVALRNLLVSLALLVTVIGLMWLIGGIMELVSAFGGPGGAYRVWRVALGVLSVAAALFLLFWPDLSLVTLVYLAGVWMIVMGLIQAAMVFWVRRALTV